MHSCSFLLAVCSQAQTAEQILDSVDKEINQYKTKGLFFTIEMRVPSVSVYGIMDVYLYGDKTKTVIKDEGKVIEITWYDETTTWEYDVAKKMIISYSNSEDNSSMQLDMFKGLQDTYHVVLEHERESFWALKLTRLETADPSEPETMYLNVSKETGLPIRWRMVSGNFDYTILNFAHGVTERHVTFDPDEYPNVTIKYR